MFLFPRGPDQPPDHVPVAQAEAPDLRDRQVDVVVGRQHPLGTQKPEPLRQDLEGPAPKAVIHALRLRPQDGDDEVVLPQGRGPGNVELPPDLAEVHEVLGGQVAVGVLGLGVGERFHWSEGGYCGVGVHCGRIRGLHRFRGLGRELADRGLNGNGKRSGLRRILLRGLDDLSRRIRRLHLRRRDDLPWTPARTGHPGSRFNHSRGRGLRRTEGRGVPGRLLLRLEHFLRGAPPPFGSFPSRLRQAYHEMQKSFSSYSSYIISRSPQRQWNSKRCPDGRGERTPTPGAPQRETHDAGEGEDEKKLHDAPPSGTASAVGHQ